ncbi:hypothetical protein [Amycolatopsis sp. NPDC004169]|uniref:hypothetical protein n=1 Tax=Amycolatopsis sp. NPDC004169 TaxID=3154453 RepID=UPI0033AFCAF3
MLNAGRVETGGKFIGYVLPSPAKAPRSTYGKQVADRWHRISKEIAKGRSCLFLVGSISPGPLARCTDTSLLPDGKFQAAVFQTIERLEPDLEHLGTWHSHHPNGLSEFSSGDIRHYESVVVDPNHGPDHFVAGLCVDERGLAFGLFELFSRKGAHRRVRLTTDQVIVDDSFPSLQAIVEQTEDELRSGRRPAPLESALATAFVIRERQEDSESTSWVVEGRSGPPFLGVVTMTTGAQPHVALSVNMSTPELSLQYDASGVHNTVGARKLTSELLRVVGDLETAVRRARDRS